MNTIPLKLQFHPILYSYLDMRDQVFHAFTFLKAIAKRVVVLLVSTVMLLGLTQPAAMAVNNYSETQTRLGAPSVPVEVVRDETRSEAQARRREWQSQASSMAKKNEPNTSGEKLNVEELVEGYEPSREAEKRSVPTP